MSNPQSTHLLGATTKNVMVLIVFLCAVGLFVFNLYTDDLTLSGFEVLFYVGQSLLVVVFLMPLALFLSRQMFRKP